MSGAKSSYAAADVRYVAAFQQDAMPARLRLACALADVVWNPPDPERLTIVDIGCGRGLTACLLAAANPGWEVVGLDLQPAHIAEAQEIAAEAGLSNARFIEADLTELDAESAARLLPEADIVISYGVWTWVPDAVREGLLRVLRARLKPGGLLLLGYNALPGFGDSIVLQRLLQDAASGLSGAPQERGPAVLDVLERLRKAGSTYLPRDAVLDRQIASARNAPAYMAHEWFTGFWRPAFAADVARDMAHGARLDFACSARPADAMPELQLLPEQRAAVEAMPPWMDRELLYDMFLMRRFRTDVFVRGRRPGGRAALRDMAFALARAPEACMMKLKTQVGQAELAEAAERAVIGTLATGPRTLGELAALPACEGLSTADIGLLLAETGTALPLWSQPPGSPEARERAARCNAAVRRHLAVEAAAVNSALGIVVPALGGAIPCRASDLALVVALQGGVPPDPRVLAEHLVAAEDGEEARARAAKIIGEVLRDHLLAWRALGFL